MRRRPAAVLAALLLQACIAPPQPRIEMALLDTLPESVPRAPAGADAILVQRPQARPALDTTRMAFRSRSFEVDYYGLHRWAETPPQMLQPLLVRTLERTGHFTAVLLPPGRARYALRTDVLELLQDVSGSPAVLRLSLRVQLNDPASGRVIATREIRRTQPMERAAPAAGVAAANLAVADALQEVAGFVLEHAR